MTERRWTDDRMDDLKHQADELARRMGEGFSEQRKEMNAHFHRMEARLDRFDDRFDRTQEMIVGLHATASRISLTFVIALIGLVATQAGLILTQL